MTVLLIALLLILFHFRKKYKTSRSLLDYDSNDIRNFPRTNTNSSNNSINSHSDSANSNANVNKQETKTDGKEKTFKTLAEEV